MYVYCIDICIILIEFCFALMDMAFYSIAIRLPGTVPVDIFGQYKKNILNKCIKYLLLVSCFKYCWFQSFSTGKVESKGDAMKSGKHR